MKTISSLITTAIGLVLCSSSLPAYERLQGPTEVLYWNKASTYAGYTFFGARSNTYLINLEGRVVQTWPVGTNPHLLDSGNVLDAANGDVSGFSGLQEVDWSGNTVWQYTEARTNYALHHDFLRIYNAKLGTNTTLYIAAKTVSSNACVAAGCNPANGPYTNAQVDAIVEVDMAGSVVWEWCFFDHGIQDFDAGKSNYVGVGKSISNYPGRLNLNLPGRPVTNDWLHCNSIDYNTNLDQIVINAAGGEFYVIDHGNTFVAGNPTASIALAAGTNGDFLYRFGDPARYSQGNPPSIQQNWATSTTGNKQIGASSHAQWIPAGMPGAGHFLVFNNGGDLFETTPQSYIFELNGYLNASTNDTGAYVNPPTAGYYNWPAPGHDTDKRTKSMSRQITWMYYSMANQGMFSHLDSSVQRLPNGNTLICDSTEGHIFEVTATGDAVWEYINPVTEDGISAYKRDNWPMQNAVFRAYRFATNHPALAGRTLIPQSTITGSTPSYISAPTISGTAINPTAPTATTSVWVTSVITNSGGVASATLSYIVGSITNTVVMLDDGLHHDGAAGDGVYGGQIPAFAAGANVSYYVAAQDNFGLTSADPSGAPGSRYSYAIQAGVTNTPPTLEPQLDRTVNPGYTLMVTNIAHDTDLPAQSLTFSLLHPPANTSINTTSGVVTFSPTLAQYGTTNPITVIVTDNGSPALSATNSFQAIVVANTAPALSPVSDRTIKPADVLLITNFATDAEAPPQVLRYSLAEGPASARINVTNGLLTWATSEADAATTNDFLVIVSDNGIPDLLDGQWFTVIVSSNHSPTNTGWSMLKLPDTGQTNRYTATFGQDADYTINPPSFADNGDGTVTDQVTGLVWQKADGGEMTWSNAVLYAQTNRVGGRSDWRLPTSHEAFSILNHGTVNPALNTTYFTLSAAQYWWTADAQATDATRIWAINAGGGLGAHRQDETQSAGGTNRYHARCVRGVPLSGWAVHHFTNDLDGTITDLDTGLTWQQAEVSAITWESALQYAEGLTLGGFSDWRLPNIKELQSINDESLTSPSVNTNFFVGANTSRHWSSTTVVNLTNRAWHVDFQLGLVSYEDKLNNLFVRCVRGGTTNGTPTNSFTPQFVKIPAGQYQMGDHFGFVDPVHPSDEVPLHNVYVDSFYMETTLLTCLEYVQFLNLALAQGLVEVRSNYVYGVGGTNIYCDTYGSDTNSRVQWSGGIFTTRDHRDLHPITGVRWFGAIAYCNWASARDGYTACYNPVNGECVLTNNGYRLPTEAEWEYAARGGLYSPYGMFPWGSDTNADGTLANWAGKNHPFASGPSPWTTPVGFYNGSLQYQTNYNWSGTTDTYQTRNNANGFGLYDMSGNVWEWVNDWYTSDYYTNCVLNNIVTNPPGPLTGSPMPDGKPYRGLRGGNWFNGEDQYGHGRVSNRDPSYYRGPGDPNGPWFHVGFRLLRRGYVTTNLPPVISTVSLTPATPTTNDTVWITARVTDDVAVSQVTLNYRTGTGGGVAQTNAVFLETMRTSPVKPWTGDACNNAWTVITNGLNPFEQRDQSNYGSGNTNGMEFKGGTTNLTDSMIATTGFMDARGNSGWVEFWLQTLTISNQYGNAGWTFQLDSGSGYVTRLSELSSTNHGWKLYHYDLQAGELVSSLKLRFQFRGGSTESRMDLDQISVKVVTGGGSTFTNVSMLDDGVHHDGAAGDGTYGAAIPALPLGTTVNYYLVATDSGSLTTTDPAGAPGATLSYTVQAGGASNSPPVIANATMTPSSPTASDSVWITAQVTDNVSVAQVTLTYNAGAGATSVAMLDDGAHQDGAAGDGTYGGQIPAMPAGTAVSFYLTAADNLGATTLAPSGAPGTAYFYHVQSASTTQTMGLFLNTTNAWPGYTLMAPMHHTNTYLINNAGEVVHMWTSTYEPGRSAYLMTNGHLFRAGMVKQGGPSTGGGEGGRVEEYDWDGNLVWEIDYFSPTYIHHHDFNVLPNGNVLLLVAEKKTLAEVIAAGFNTNLLDASILTQGYMLPDCLVEVTPTRPYGGTVVWEWHLWDHMIQDYDPTKNNYGVVAAHPERIDVNGTGIKIPQFWNHVNGIDHNVQLDQVMLSIRGNSELFVIDHQTTTAQAAGTNGGRYNTGGDILYRWGNPQQYNRGTSANQVLFQQHHTHWIETNCPGAGNILVFNNGIGRGYSTINEIVPPVDAAGNYSLSAGAAFGPSAPAWTYVSSPPTNFYSAEISGAQRLPNGNTLICEGIKGNLFEVTAAGQTVWRYLCPVTSTILTQGDSIPVDPARTDQFMNAVFRVSRYSTNYAGLIGRDLTPQGTIELPVDQTLRLLTSAATSSGLQFSWSSLSSRNYAVLYKATLNAPTWAGIATNRSIGTLTTFTDTNAIRLSQPHGFYRVTLLP